jgi:hypothetical protein
MPPTNEEKHAETYQAAEAAVRGQDPATLAARAGARWIPAVAPARPADPPAAGALPGGTLELSGFGGVACLSWPRLDFSSEHPLLQLFPWRLIALHYLAGATGRGPGEDWIGYRELPDGLFYANTVTREVEAPMAERFGRSPDEFLTAGRALGGVPVGMADAALVFHPLPRVPILAALWVEDEEFPAKVKVLYERAGAENLPLQDLRILADLLWAGLNRVATPTPANGGPSGAPLPGDPDPGDPAPGDPAPARTAAAGP